MSASIVFTTSDGAREARTDIRASSASCVVGELVGGAHGGVLPGEPGPEQQRVVGAQGHRGAGLEQLGEGYGREVAVDPERHVGDRAHLERDALLDDPLQQRRVLDRADAVPEPVGAQRVEAGAHGLRPHQLAAVRHQREPTPVGDREGRREVGGVPRRSSLDSPKPTTPWSTYCTASRARIRASIGCRVRLAAMITAMPRPVRCRGVAHAVEDQVGERGDPAEARGVPRRVDLDLQPPSAVADVVLGRLQHQPAYVVLGAEHGPRHVVEALEAEPALLVGRRQHRRPVAPRARRAARCRRAAASSTSVACRIEPVKCRCRCAFGSRERSPARPLKRTASAAG